MDFNDRRKTTGKPTYKVSDNVTVKSPTGENLSLKSTSGARQAKIQNLDANAPVSKGEAKANKRGLKSANSNTVFKVNKPMTRLVAGTAKVGRNVQVTPGSKKEARLQKRNEWAEKYGTEQMKKFDAKMKKGK